MKSVLLAALLAFPGCHGHDNADPDDQKLLPCPEHFGGASVVSCFKNDCNWCLVKSGTKWVVCEDAVCGK